MAIVGAGARARISLGRSIAALGVVVACLVASSPAVAQAPEGEGGKLFAEASTLMNEAKWSEALKLLERAQAIDPGIGTQFNIGVCQEKLGRVATAYRTFNDVMRLARASGKKPREDAAREKVAELRQRVPAFVVRSDEPGDVLVKIDGAIVAKEEWEFVPVDPGDHRVEASAPTKKAWATTVAAPAGGEKRPITIPPLGVVEQTKIVTVETSNGRRTLGLVLGGVGLAGVAVATVTGIVLLDAKATADDRCRPKCVDDAGQFDQTGVDAVNRGKSLLAVNLIAWGVAIAGIGAGTFFLLTSKKSAEPARTAVTPLIGPTGGGLRVDF